MKKDLNNFLNYIDDSIEDIAIVASAIQADFYEWLINNYVGISDDNIDDFLLVMRRRLNSIAAIHGYSSIVASFIMALESVRPKIITMLNKHNKLSIPTDKWLQYGDFIKTIVTDTLTSAMPTIGTTLSTTIMRSTISDSGVAKVARIITKWNNGTQNTFQGLKTPNLAQYVEDNAANGIMLAAGAYTNLAAKEFNMDGFMYVGDIIKDSRTLCKHLVGLDRNVRFTELPLMLENMPDGLYPNTTKDNFMETRGGYNCRHFAFPVVM